ncbi:protein brown isoform X2 [Eurosta solidaginis]
MKTGDLVAILGCSGAGKTTLLAAISQRLRGNLTGEIVLNGIAMRRTDMTRISSFLPQFEINVKTFTAYEHLYFMSHFKMHRKTTKAQKRQRVNDLLYACGLRDSAHTRIQSLSGGERKRLSLAEELITDPPLIFCDEPTTGLDSYSAYTVIKTLRHLCTRQRVVKHSLSSVYGDDSFSIQSSCEQSSTHDSIEMTALKYNTKELSTLDMFNNSPNGHHRKAIMCSIHQPSSDLFELFTHVILMDAGRVIFQGSSERALKFFTDLGYALPQNCNPADFYLKTISDSHTKRKDGELIKAKYDNEIWGRYSGSWLLPRPNGGDYLQHINNFQKISWFYQVYLLLIRFMTENSRNIRQSFITLGFLMITSAILAIMYSGVTKLTQTSVQDIDGSIYTLSNEMIFTFSYGVTYVFPMALPIMRREVGEGTYNLSAYYVASVLSFVPTAFFTSYMFFSIIYAAIYYTRGFMLYLTMGFVLALSAIAATAYGLFLSSFFETVTMASECAGPFDLLFLIFGGAYYNVDSLPFIKFISLFFYSNEALMYNFWIDVDEIECPKNVDHPCVKTGVEVLKRRSYRTADYTYWADCLGLVGVAVVFNIIAFCFIRKYVRRSGYY